MSKQYKIKKLPNHSNFEKIVENNFSQRLKEDDLFAKQFYASLCNTIWFNESTNDLYSCSWRYAGGFIAKIRNKDETYMEFYCSGNEGNYHEEVYKELAKLGYKSIKDKKCTNLNPDDFK